MVVLIACEADSYRVGARDQFSVSDGWFLGFKKRHRISMGETQTHAKRSQKINVQLYSTFIEKSAEKQPRESRLDLGPVDSVPSSQHGPNPTAFQLLWRRDLH